MSVSEEKKFVMKHVFEDIMSLEDSEKRVGPEEHHFNFDWCVQVSRFGEYLLVNVNFEKCASSVSQPRKISFCTTTILKNDQLQQQHEFDFPVPAEIHMFPCATYDLEHPETFVNDGNLVLELSVTLGYDSPMTVVEQKKNRVFDDEAAKETSDVTLIVKDQKFHVCKMYLSSHSSYFKALFLGNFSEAGKSEIEIKEIDPNDFQYFLEFLYAESEIQDHNVLGILHLANFSDSKTVIRKCQQFLMEKSSLSLKQKFEAAIKYNLEELKTKCLSEIETPAILRSIIPDEDVQCGEAVLRELLAKSMTFFPK